MRIVGILVVVVLLLLGGTLWWLKFDKGSPTVTPVAMTDSLGNKAPLDLDVRAEGPGLREVTVRLNAGGTVYELFKETYPATSWRGSELTEKRIHLEPDLLALQVPEGQATLDVLVDTYGWGLGHGKPALSKSVNVDRTPPTVELLTSQHNGRLGGMELAVFRQSPDTVSSAIEVGPYVFPATTGYFTDPTVAVAFFAIPQDLNVDARPMLVARDAAGNRREANLPVLIKPRRFPERSLAIDDAFLSRKVPEIERVNGIAPATDLVKGYLYINNDLRKQSEAKIKEVTAKSAPAPMWDGAFHRQTNAAPLSAFADRRVYMYKGAAIDHQTHLGYDLASLKNANVEAAQNGVVVFAGNLGIYGNTVILDHGLGVFTLYGHMNTITVKVGDTVQKGGTLGQSGETGLAGGDHIHYSTMLYGTHVDPVEWWDPLWIKKHVAPKLALLPSAHAPVAAQPAAGSAAPAGAKATPPAKAEPAAKVTPAA